MAKPPVQQREELIRNLQRLLCEVICDGDLEGSLRCGAELVKAGVEPTFDMPDKLCSLLVAGYHAIYPPEKAVPKQQVAMAYREATNCLRVADTLAKVRSHWVLVYEKLLGALDATSYRSGFDFAAELQELNLALSAQVCQILLRRNKEISAQISQAPDLNHKRTIANKAYREFRQEHRKFAQLQRTTKALKFLPFLHVIREVADFIREVADFWKEQGQNAENGIREERRKHIVQSQANSHKASDLLKTYASRHDLNQGRTEQLRPQRRKASRKARLQALAEAVLTVLQTSPGRRFYYRDLVRRIPDSIAQVGSDDSAGQLGVSQAVAMLRSQGYPIPPGRYILPGPSDAGKNAALPSPPDTSGPGRSTNRASDTAQGHAEDAPGFLRQPRPCE